MSNDIQNIKIQHKSSEAIWEALAAAPLVEKNTFIRLAMFRDKLYCFGHIPVCAGA